jgi:hypothetical protein
MHLSLANVCAAELGNQEMALRRISLGPEAGFLDSSPRFDPKTVNVEYGVPCHAKPLLEKERSSFLRIHTTSCVFVSPMFQLQTLVW